MEGVREGESMRQNTCGLGAPERERVKRKKGKASMNGIFFPGNNSVPQRPGTTFCKEILQTA